MNIEHFLLLLHILGAISVGVLVLAAGVSLCKRKVQYQKPLAISIALNTGIQLVSGSLLTLTTQYSESLFSFCNKVGVYIVIVLIVEMLLFKQIHKTQIFPGKLILSSLTFGMVFVVMTLFYL